ncbi:DUF362 domain-containing protein [Selenomonas sp. ND2010]|uniref:DUF362 domain-containing protein n=1 Tax=Selenomonas sp. ND2010 TaxID=1410618 RepID=UPI00051B055E|nr:DUF362 domain-containing protein [Selenomonas sp. ND2010]
MFRVGIQYEKNTTSYPNSVDFFSPSVLYPEYLWTNEIARDENKAYKLVRDCFITLGLDKENIGRESWNPLGEYIQKDNTVLLKPNWVENKNKNKKVHDDLACLVTNPSIARAVIDYVLIALKGSGRIIIADAPMQGCDLDTLFKITGYDRLFEFYEKKKVKLEIYDLRKYSVERKYKGVFLPPKLTNNGLESLLINLKDMSMHAEKNNINPRYKVEDYEQHVTESYHGKGNHIYEVNQLPLEADVIINLPKPKTHRLAGLTGGCKNFVGITFEKASLPHRIDGDFEKEQGDAYKKHSIWNNMMRYFNEKRTHYSRKGEIKMSKINDVLMKISYVMRVILSGDKYRVGSWYGNDTIWRTVVDLNNIILHADKNGVMHDDIQRKIITIGDMIIGGEKEGPVGPSPKELGIILFSDNNLLFDRVVCDIMGFDSNKFKMFNDKKTAAVFSLKKRILEETIVKSNFLKINDKKICDMIIPNEWHFKPHSCWKGYIEK